MAARQVPLDLPQLLTVPANGSLELLVPVLLSLSSVLFQAHCDLGAVRIGPTAKPPYEEGRHVGFVVPLAPSAESATAFLGNGGPEPLVVLFWASGLSPDQPVPGGCAMESNLDEVPTVHHSEFRGVVAVDWAPPGLERTRLQSPDRCESFSPKAADYRFRLYARLRDDDDAFGTAVLAIRNSTAAEERGTEIISFPASSPTHLVIGDIPGKAIALVVTVENIRTGGAAAYVPSLQQASPIEQGFEPDSIAMKAACGVVIAVGLVFALIGHRNLHYGQMNVGWMLGLIVIVPLMWSFKPTWLLESSDVDLLLSSAALGLIGGLVLLLVWEFSGNAIVIFASSNLLFGFVIASIVAYFGLDNWELLYGSAVGKWLSFVIIWILVPCLLTVWIRVGLPIACAGTGATLVVAALSFLLNANLHFILIRAMQRFVLPEYQTSLRFFVPFQTLDGILIGVWAAVLVLGTLLQLYITKHWDRGLPPPPSRLLLQRFRRRRLRRAAEGEADALIRPDPTAPPADYGAA